MITKLPIRLLGDAVLRRTAWQYAYRLGWEDTYTAEYVALTHLQATPSSRSTRSWPAASRASCHRVHRRPARGLTRPADRLPGRLRRETMPLPSLRRSTGERARVHSWPAGGGKTPVSCASVRHRLGRGPGAPVAQADTTLSSCSPAAFDAAVTAGGTVRFGLDCPSLVVTRTTVIPVGKTLDIEGNGHAVALSGGGVRQLFKVTGGRLTVRAVTIQGGAAVGPAARTASSELPVQTAAAAPTARAAHPASRVSRAARERPAVLEARARRAGPGAGPGAAPCSS